MKVKIADFHVKNKVLEAMQGQQPDAPAAETC